MSTATPQWARDEKARVGLIKTRFLSAYGVKPYRFERANARLLLLQGGASEKDLTRALRDVSGAQPKSPYLYNRGGPGNPFDHEEMYGRRRVPLFLIGHPYNIGVGDDPYIADDAAWTLDALRSLGLSVRVLGEEHSWYGFGTAHVAVYHWPTVERLCSPCPIYPPTGERQVLCDILSGAIRTLSDD
jgi:hypothetical protein